MLKPIPSPQYWTAEAAQWVAHQLGLRYHNGMQDWPWEVATSEGLESYFQLYPRATAAAQIVLMEMILESASNQAPDAGLQKTWPRIEELLDQQADLHATTAQYWCVWSAEEDNLDEEAFPISPYMRQWWRANYPLPAD